MVWHGIHLSAIAKQLPAIRGYLQEDGRLIDLQDETYRMSPLIWSCVMGHDDVAAWLLARGASVDLVDSGGRSALFYASKIGYLDLVSLLLKHNPDVRKQSAEGMTPLIIASACGHTEVVRALVAHVYRPPTISKEGKAAAAATPPSSSSPTSEAATGYLDLVTKRGNSAVHCASRFPQILKLLLQEGANPTLVNHEGHTALEISLAKNVPASVRVLKRFLQEKETRRARLLFKARALSDAAHTLHHTRHTAKTRAEKHRKCVAVAPAYVKERVEEGAALPLVVVGGEGREGRRRKRKRGKEGAAGVAGAKKRRDAGKETVDGMKEEEDGGEESVAVLYKAQAIDSIRQAREAVLAYAVGGGLTAELFVELIDMLLPRWDRERVGGR
ncbi:ankyrin repeat domain protein [Nannochloropsis oceanica]